MERARKNNVKILPVDSEHSAIYQCIGSKDFSQIKRKIIITGSGGPFIEIKHIQDIQKKCNCSGNSYPRQWSMGDKITVDSATLMNKGLEVIEAHWLFDIDYDNIDVIIHPQSLMHGAVEFVDGSMIAQLGIPDMHIPIQFAFLYPERCCGP